MSFEICIFYARAEIAVKFLKLCWMLIKHLIFVVGRRLQTENHYSIFPYHQPFAIFMFWLGIEWKYPYVMQSMHYAEVEKFGLKWSTLTSHFSAHFCTKGAKFLTGMSELPKNLKKIKKWKLKINWGRKKTKNLLLVFAKKKVGVKKIVLINAKILVLNTFLANTSK